MTHGRTGRNLDIFRVFQVGFKTTVLKGVKRKVWLKSAETGWKTRTGWNFNAVIIFYRLYFITAEFHSRSVPNFKSVSAMKSLEMSPVEFFLPVLFAKTQFDFIFHCPFVNQCQTPCTPTDAHYYPLPAGSHPPCYFCICKFQGSFTKEPTTPVLSGWSRTHSAPLSSPLSRQG